MAKNKKPHRRPGPGKPQGATYAQMLAHKAAVRKGLEQAARDATVQVEADTSKTTRTSWSGCGLRWTRNMHWRSSARRPRLLLAWRCITSTSRRLCWLRCRRPRRGCQPMSKRIIQTTPSGEWGIPGVDLASLPPRVYGALCKLKDMEELLEIINSPTARAWERDDAIEQLISMGN